jgi:hypothetical protein
MRDFHQTQIIHYPRGFILGSSIRMFTVIAEMVAARVMPPVAHMAPVVHMTPMEVQIPFGNSLTPSQY